MGSAENKYGLAHYLGKVTIPRVSTPTIRGTVRASSPDGGNPTPYWTALSAKTLILSLTPVGALTVTFTGNDLDTMLADVNAVSPANLRGDSDDGYLRITNLNTGGKNSLAITGGTSLAILGFVSSPEPGYISYAGELATASSGRGTTLQNNPQGTALIAHDEDLTSSVINRAIMGVTAQAERALRELDIRVPVFERILATINTHVPSGIKFVAISEPTLKFPVELGSNPVPAAVYDGLIGISTFPDDLEYIDIDNPNSYLRVSAIYYGDGTEAVYDASNVFTTWGTLDGMAVNASSLKNKQAPVNITEIHGNVIVAATAAFTTAVTLPGDTIVIEASTNTVPFSHVGEFIVTEVLDQTRIVVRAKSAGDTSFVGVFPTELNPLLPGGTVYGTVRVIVGSDIPITNFVLELPSWAPDLTQVYVRVLHYKRLRDITSTDELHLTRLPGTAGIGASLSGHVDGSVGRHLTTTLDGGATAGVPNSLASGTAAAQLIQLLGFINATATYNGGGTWADGTTNPSATIEAQLDKILTDLAGAGVDGAIKIRALIDGSLPAGTVRSQLNYLRDNYFAVASINGISGQNIWTADQFSSNMEWQVGASNPLLKPCFRTPITVAANQHQLIWDFGPIVGTQPHLRLYLDSNDQFEIVWNAEWSTAATDFWLCDDSAQHAVRVVIGPEFHIQYKSATASFFADSFFTTTGDQVKVDLVNSAITILGVIKHGTRTRVIPLSAGNVQSNTHTYQFASNGAYVTFITTAMFWHMPITLDIGHRILEVRTRVQDTATGPNAITVTLWSFDGSGTAASIATATSSGAGGLQNIDLTGLTELIAADKAYSLTFTSAGATGTTGIYAVEFDYDTP